MTDQEYYECYSLLESRLVETHELDPEIFLDIFEGKIKPIIRNTFTGLSGVFAATDLEDLYQDIFVKLWTRCVGAYFMNEKYETSAAWFLGWCKTVAKNHVTSLIRKKSERASETLDDPDHPITVVAPGDPAEEIARTEAVATVFSAIPSLPSKAELKLTWLSVYLSLYEGESADRIEATHLFCDKYRECTLGDVLSDVNDAAARCGVFTDKDALAPVMTELGDKRDALLSDVLGYDPLGKVSDWLYKVNKKLSTTLPPEVTKWNI